MEHTLKLSDILAVMIRDKLKFTCHAIIKHAGENLNKKIIWSEGYRIVESNYLDSLHTIAPNHFKTDEYPGFQITSWLKNMPGHLRGAKLLFEEEAHNYRVKLLKWMINKFGDQEIQVVILERHR